MYSPEAFGISIFSILSTKLSPIVAAAEKLETSNFHGKKVAPPSLETLKSRSFINEGVGSSSTPDGKTTPGGSVQVIDTIKSLVPSD